MEEAPVLVVAETASLAQAVVDLLEAGGIPTHSVPDLRLEPGSTASSLPPQYHVVVAACNEHYCRTGRQWMRHPMAGVELVVVGCRDPALVPSSRMHVVPLPLVATDFLSLMLRLAPPTRACAAPG
jgi:hypothetical protein